MEHKRERWSHLRRLRVTRAALLAGWLVSVGAMFVQQYWVR